MAVKIVCFGDSLTRGVSYVKGRVRILKENYPSFLEKQLKTDQMDDMVIINKGVFNDNSKLLVDRLDKDVISEHPNFVLIGVGGNDCNFKWEEVAAFPDDTHEAIVPLSEYIENIKRIVMRVKESNITPILLTLPPLDPVRYYQYIASVYGSKISHWISRCGGIDHWHNMYNKQLKILVDQLDVITIDVRSALCKSGEIDELVSDDGIHLNSTGYREMSNAIYNGLISVMNKNSPLQS